MQGLGSATASGIPHTGGKYMEGRPGSAVGGEPKVGGIEQGRLRSLVELIERLEEERAMVSGDIKDVYAEAKSVGFDVAVLRQVIRLRRKEAAEVEEQETLLDLYRRALGM